ncbi:dihydrofolate reductase family protein [Chloroflexota bacterium]
MTNFVYIATSIDGFIATKDGGVDWLNDIPNPEQSDFGFAKFMSGINAIVMGRNTFEQVLTFGSWPYDKPVFVLSNTLAKIPSGYESKVEIVNGDLGELVGRLHEKGYSNLYIDGGKTIQNFLAEDLIDEMIITKIPVLLGDGIPLFGKIDQSLKFSHIKTEVINDSLVMSHFSRER